MVGVNEQGAGSQESVDLCVQGERCWGRAVQGGSGDDRVLVAVGEIRNPVAVAVHPGTPRRWPAGRVEVEVEVDVSSPCFREDLARILRAGTRLTLYLTRR